MGDSIPEQVRKSYQEHLGSTPKPTDAQIRSAIEGSAPIGVNNDPRYAPAASQAGIEYYERGVPPEEAAVAGAVSGRNAMMKNKPNLQDVGSQFRNDLKDTSNFRVDEPWPGSWWSTENQVSNFNDANKLNMDSESRNGLASVLDNSDVDGATPGAADMAAGAAVNVASGGTASPSGLEIFGNLNIKVHGAVTFNLDGIHIKTVKGVAKYNHDSDVTIHAPTSNVKLKADTVSIEASTSETNTVENDKSSTRGISIILGPLAYTTRTTGLQQQFTGFSASVFGGQAHVGTIKIGAAMNQDTVGIARFGFTAFEFEKMNKREMAIGGMLAIGPVIFVLML